MKPNPWMFPALALLAVGGWIVSQKRGAATLEHDITVITSRIRQARIADEAGQKSHEAEEKARKEKERKIDWKDIAGKINQAHGGEMPDMRTMMRMQRLLMDLSGEELCAQLDEIDSLDLADDTRDQLRSMIFGILVEKDPKQVLERYGKDIRNDNSGMNWQMSFALQKWAEKDSAAAAAWLDRQIVDGKLESKSLDGKNPELMRFEVSLMSVLFKSDPAAAAARLKSVPEAQREEVFQQGAFINLAKNDEAAYAKVVRDSLPADKVGGVLAKMAQTLVARGGYERVDGFIESTRASEAEKESIVMQVMKSKSMQNGDSKFSEEEFDKARAWAAGQAPAVVDKATGDALGFALRRDEDFGRISELVLKYNGSAGNDDVLAAFLRSKYTHSRSMDEAVKLIDKIKDPALREEIRSLPQYRQQPTGP